MNCKLCGDTGVYDTGNNDLPCECPAGATAWFNETGVRGAVSGAEIKKHFLNGSPEPIHPGRGGIDAAALPGRRLDQRPADKP